MNEAIEYLKQRRVALNCKLRNRKIEDPIDVLETKKLKVQIDFIGELIAELNAFENERAQTLEQL